MLDWQSLFGAIALLLILEGLLPFFNPAGYKALLEKMRDLPETVLRNFGLGMLTVGLILLYLVR